MPVVDTVQTFNTGDTVTSTTLNNIMDQSIFVAGAVVSGSGLAITAGGQMTTSGIPGANITDGTITTTKIADLNVTTAKIADANVTTAKIADSNVTTAKIADSNVTTIKIADANVTPAKLSGAQTGAAPVFGIRAWGYIDNVVGVFAGGTPTVTKVSGNALCTVTTTTPHGLITGNYVYVNTALTGIAVGFRPITKTSNTEFTFTASTTGAHTNVFIDLKFANPLGNGNINSVAWDGSLLYRVNLSNEMSAVHYAVLVNNSGYTTTNGVSVSSKQVSSFLLTQTGSTDEIELMVIE